MTLSDKALCFGAVPSLHSSVDLSGQILLPRYFMKAWTVSMKPTVNIH